MYKIYLDKNEDFICEISVKNASTKGSKARLIVESAEGINFIFNGKIENGKCTVPIRRLKGLLEENSTGKISLECIIEDTYFEPWNSQFIAEEHTSVKVNLSESKLVSKPSVQVKVPVKEVGGVIKKGKVAIPIKEAVNICRKCGLRDKKDIFQLLRTYLVE